MQISAPYFLIGLAFVFSIIEWILELRHLKKPIYIVKPLIMGLIILCLLSAGGYTFPLAWFTFGMIFSLVGDIVLMLPRDRFLPGLGAFLAAQLCYIMGLNSSKMPVNITVLIIAAIVFLGSFQLYRRISLSLQNSGNTSLRLPTLIYSIVISLFVFSAILTLVRPESEWKTTPAFLISIGAVLFYLSDVILAWNKFIEPLPNDSFWNSVTYFMGQILLALGAVLNFYIKN
jgi:uncharacterized membrane protein YhhN